jgi:hypothetical protein
MSDAGVPGSRPFQTFAFDDVVRHLRIHHPGCPKKTCLTIAARISAKNCDGRKLGAMVGIELQSYVRHNLTDYDELRRSRMMTREEARAFIEPQVEGILRAWRKPALKLRLVRSASGDK